MTKAIPRLRHERWIEALAVASNLLYTLFYLRGSVWCFVFGLFGPFLLAILTWHKRIYADTFLQLFYFGVTLYGFCVWGGEWKIIHWSGATHLIYIVSALAVALTSGYVLKKKTNAALPYLDSFTTVYAIIATWMMMNFVHENWIYFMVINTTSLFIYINRKLYLGAGMFFLYLLMSVDGYFELNLFRFW